MAGRALPEAARAREGGRRKMTGRAHAQRERRTRPGEEGEKGALTGGSGLPETQRGDGGKERGADQWAPAGGERKKAEEERGAPTGRTHGSEAEGARAGRERELGQKAGLAAR